MESQSEHNPDQGSAEAAAHFETAHEILKDLPEKLGKHPEIGAALRNWRWR